MPRTGQVPKRNVERRRRRREHEHRQRERTFWAFFLFGWIGALWAWFANSQEERDFARRARERAARRILEEDPVEYGDEVDDVPPPIRGPGPKPSDRHVRAELRRVANRRRLVQTAIVVTGGLLLYFAYMWVRFKLRGH